MLSFIPAMPKRIYGKYRSWAAESPSTRDYRLFLFQVRKHGFINFVFNGTYTQRFFEDHNSLLPAYHELGEIIYETFKPISVLDVGCGNAFLIQWLNARGVKVLGVEGASEATAFIDHSIKDKVVIKDLSQTHVFGKFDLVISTEVAEHIPKKYSLNFIKNLTRNAQNHILFSAAHPGQWGDGHINCRPKTFWISLMEGEGWKYLETRTSKFTELVSKKEIVDLLPWALSNFMIFAPESSALAPYE